MLGIEPAPPWLARHRLLIALVASLTVGVGSREALHAAEPPPPLALSQAQQAAVAREFAPTLVFHPLEDYFPISASFRSDDAETQVEGWRARVADYRTLSLEAKTQRAALAYRVFTRVRAGRQEVIVEYWCYYVYNAFTVRGSWLPYRVQGNHPHDLERLYLVLIPTRATTPSADIVDDEWAGGAFEVRSVIANAHDGSIPPNHYDLADDETLSLPLSILVERGSHAMAPDLNNDGRFTPGVDSNAVLKLQWGIRDRGATWGRYRASFMDGRESSAVRLCGPTTVRDQDESCSRYALYPADGVQDWFRGLQLSPGDRQMVVGRAPWLMRTFGDVRVEDLMVPLDPPNGRVLDTMLNRRTRSEAGFLAGFTTVKHAPAAIVGRRQFWAVRSRRAPDVIAEAVTRFPKGRRPDVEATLWGSYSVDAITNIVLGVGAFSEGERMDVVAGIDLRLGRFRVRPAWRLRDGKLGSRLTTTF